MGTCGACGGTVEIRFRFCPWCAAPQRLKLVEFFRAHPGIASDRGRALRVSRYLGGDEQHVRFSVWSETRDGARAEAAVSIDEVEARRLARFLGWSGRRAERPAAALERLLRR